MDKNRADNVLRAALSQDRPDAVELIWDRYANDLFGFLQGMLCSKHDAEDVLQSVFVNIVRKRHRLARARCLDAYVFQIARNEAFSMLRRRKKRQSDPPVEESWFVARRDDRSSIDLAEHLGGALSRLPQSQREVVVLKIYRDKTFLEIARLLGLSKNTVASRYRYGIEKLRTLLEGFDHE